MKRFTSGFKFIFFIVFCCEIFFSGQLLAAGKRAPESPTRIRSDIIDIKRKSQTINFFNNVVVEKDDSSLLANKMTVFYEEDEGPKKKYGTADFNTKSESSNAEIKRIEAFDNVKIFSEEFIASGDFGYYEPQKNIFVLEKNVIVNNGTSIASGDKFIYDLVTKKGHFVGKKNETTIAGEEGKKRVMVVIGDDLKDQKKPRKKVNTENEQQTP